MIRKPITNWHDLDCSRGVPYAFSKRKCRAGEGSSRPTLCNCRWGCEYVTATRRRPGTSGACNGAFYRNMLYQRVLTEAQQTTCGHIDHRDGIQCRESKSRIAHHHALLSFTLLSGDFTSYTPTERKRTSEQCSYCAACGMRHA